MTFASEPWIFRAVILLMAVWAVCGSTWMGTSILPQSEGMMTSSLRRQDRMQGFGYLITRTSTLWATSEAQGGTYAERSADWYEQTQLLMAVMQMHLAPGLLQVDGPYLGIPEGETHFLNARCIRPIRGPVHNRMSFQFWSFTLRCIDSPPVWQVDESS